jgi:hypothetical protein
MSRSPRRWTSLGDGALHAGPVADALWTADLTTGPRGEQLVYADRLAEIVSRYSPESPVARAMTRARPLVEGAIERTRCRFGQLYPFVVDAVVTTGERLREYSTAPSSAPHESA